MHTMTTPATPVTPTTTIITEHPFPFGLPNSERTSVHIYDCLFEKIISVVDDTDFGPYLNYEVSDGDENLYNITLHIVAITVSANLITVLLPSGKSKGIYISTADYSVLKIM